MKTTDGGVPDAPSVPARARALAALAFLGVLFPHPCMAEDFQVLETEHFVVHYAESQEKLARNAAAAAEAAFAEISAFLGSRPAVRISLAIAPDAAAFRTMSGGRIPDWGIGLASPGRRQILITSPADSPARIDLAEIVTHEVAHVLLGLTLDGPPLPRWFDEGHAMYHARQWRFVEGTRIVWALVAHTLIPLAELEGAFPYGRASAELAYTESYTAVEFLIRTGGVEAFRRLVRTAARHGDFEAALIEVYGWNLVTFEGAWREYLRGRYRWAVLPGIFTIPGIFTLLFLLAYLRKRHRARQKLAAWRDEEHRFG